MVSKKEDKEGLWAAARALNIPRPGVDFNIGKGAIDKARREKLEGMQETAEQIGWASGHSQREILQALNLPSEVTSEAATHRGNPVNSRFYNPVDGSSAMTSLNRSGMRAARSKR